MTTDQITIETKLPESVSGSCIHYWLIDPPDGPVSQGTCRTCGEQREFTNSLESEILKPAGSSWGR